MQRAVSGACVLCSTDLLLARPLALPATRSATESSFGITNLCDLLPIPVSAASTGLSVRGAVLSFHWYHRVGPLRTLYTLFLLGITWQVLHRTTELLNFDLEERRLLETPADVAALRGRAAPLDCHM